MTVTLHVGTANIQNFGAHLSDGTDLSDTDVRLDVDVTKIADVNLYQEIAEAADHKAVAERLGAAWAKTDVGTVEVPIAVRKAVLTPVKEPRVVTISPKLERPPGQTGPVLHSPARKTVEWECAWTLKGTGLPNIVFIDLHLIQSAWRVEPMALKAERQRLWNMGYDAVKARVLALVAAGFIVVVGGDWNRTGTDIKKFAPNQIWLIGGGKGIDHVALLLPKGVTAKVPATYKTAPMKSDHDYKHNVVELTGPKVTPAPAPTTPAKPAATRESVIAKITATKLLDNVAAIVDAAPLEGLPLATACALIEGESGGRNVYGHDAGGVFSTAALGVTLHGVTYPKGSSIPVTAENFALFALRLADPGAISNGVGPGQITYARPLGDGRAGGYFRQMLEGGLLPWEPLDNIRFALRILAGNLVTTKGDLASAGAHYNGGTRPDADAIAYGKKLADRAAAWNVRIWR